MKSLNRKNYPAVTRPERIIQFGEGNFLRAFVDWIVFNMNEKTGFNGQIVVVKPRPTENEQIDLLNAQDGLFQINLQGLDKGVKTDSIQVVDCISRGINPYSQFEEYMKLAENPDMRFVVSNTTEAGIAFDPDCRLEDMPALSFPGKLTQLLYRRYQIFQGAKDKGFIILPCELIFHNGKELDKCIHQYIQHWNLGEDFKTWFETACAVYSTLVDRIVPGYPKDTIEQIRERTQFEDRLVVKGEVYHLWVIEAPESVAKEFPADQAGLNVLFVPSEKAYHDRKVTLLNGPHTVLSPVGYLSGLDTVRECVEDAVIGKFVRKVMFEELMETLDLPRTELEQFGNDVLDRFRNPFVRHEVTSIMLNSFPKFKTRDLPGLKIYLERKGVLPPCIVLGLAGICTYYKGGMRGENPIVPNDAREITDLLKNLWATGSVEQVARGVLGAGFIWGEDLNLVPGLTEALTLDLGMIREKGMLETVRSIL